MANFVYNSFKSEILQANINLATDSIYVALVEDTYVPSASHTGFNQVTEITTAASGYTSNGLELSGNAISINNTNLDVIFDAEDTIWNPSTITASGAVLYKRTGSDQGPLIGFIDFGSNQTSNNGSFTIQWAATGLIRLQNTA